MGEIKWIKLSTDIFNNRKIRQIECMPDGDTIIVIWFKILALAGEINDSGQVYLTKEIPYTEQLLATQFNRPIATVRLALQTFQQFGMIEIIDNLILVSNWEKYQNIDGMERVREQNRLRNIQYRERKRLAAANSSCDNTVTSRETSYDAVEEEKEKDKDKNTPPIIPPTGGNADDKFDEFWSSYPKKVGKGDAQKAWKKIRPSKTLFTEIMNGLNAIKGSAQWTRDGGQYIPNPSTWLNQHRWEDDPKAGDMVKPKYPQHDHIPSTFDVDDAMEVALRRSYGDQYEKLYPNGVRGLYGETKTGGK